MIRRLVSLARRYRSGDLPLLCEATFELLRASWLTRIQRRPMARLLGAPSNDPPMRDAPFDDRAQRIGRIVEWLSRGLPLGTRCLQESIAVQRMLRRRHTAARLMLGVSLNADDRRDPQQQRAAHAWVCHGGRVICGDRDLQNYAVVGAFD